MKRDLPKVVYYLFFIFTSCSLLSEIALADPPNNQEQQDTKIKQDFCDHINTRFKKYGWSKILCNPSTWQFDRQYTTPGNNPLLYQVFNAESNGPTTLVMCGVHGNEISSIYQCLFLTREILYDNPTAYNDARVIIAPIVNPDGFLKEPSTRTNKNGIDLNRNFPTSDFYPQALQQWKEKEKNDKSKYPGTTAGCETETKFQMMLIDKFHPEKIISIHSPFGWLDVDSPSKKGVPESPDGFVFEELNRQTKDVAQAMSKASNRYKVTNFRVYPGSLGNYAAHEKGIPTFTLELESSDADKGFQYWQRLRKAFVTAIQFKMINSTRNAAAAAHQVKKEGALKTQ